MVNIVEIPIDFSRTGVSKFSCGNCKSEYGIINAVITDKHTVICRDCGAQMKRVVE